MPPVPAPPAIDVPDQLGAPYDVDPAFPVMQRTLGAVLLGIFTITAVVPLALVGSGAWSDAKEYLQIVLPVEVGLLGSVIGFYFGSQRSEG